MARAVLFDLDGTVWDSWPWYAQLLCDRGGGPLVDQLALIEDGRPAARLLRDAGLSTADFCNACELKAPPLYGGVTGAMRRLADAGVRLGAVTNLPQWLYAPMLAAHEDTLGFETVVGWGDTRRRKPHPDPLELAMSRLGIEPELEHWYVGDTGSDAKAAIAAGISFAWASWGYGPHCPTGTGSCLESPEQVAELA